MKVALLRNNYEAVNVSMKVYADGLLYGFGKMGNRLQIEEVMPESPVFERLSSLIPPLSRFYNYYGRYCLYPRKAKKIDAEILHIVDHTYSHLLKHIRRGKTVVTCHDIIMLKLMMAEFERNEVPPLASRLFKKAISLLYRADAVIAVSANTKDDIVKYLAIDPKKIEVIHNGISKRFLEGGPALLRDINEGPIRVLHVGGNWFYKNFEAVIEAVSLLPLAVKRRIKLVKAGSKLSSRQKGLVLKHGLDCNMEVIESIEPQRLPDLYRSCDIFVFPSLYEGFGLPPLEAMACGIPAIVSSVASLPEVCADAALYVNPNDPPGMAKMLERLIGDSALRKSLSEKGRARAKAFSWEETARKTFTLYEKLFE